MSTIFRDPPSPSPIAGSNDDSDTRRIKGLHQNCHLAPPPSHHRKYSLSPSGCVSIGTPSASPVPSSSPSLDASPSQQRDSYLDAQEEHKQRIPSGNSNSITSTESEAAPSIELHPIEPSDAEALAILFERCFTTDALRLAAKRPHLANPEDPLEERRWRIAQYQLGLQMPTSHLVKAVDVEGGGTIVGAVGFFGPGGIQWLVKGNDGMNGGPGIAGVDVPSHWDMELRDVFNRVEEEARERVLGGDYNVWELSQIYVAPEFQNKGIGRLLMDWGVKQADEEGCPVYVEATSGAKVFYEKRGFEARGKVAIPGVPCADGELYTLYNMVRPVSGKQRSRP